LEAGAIPYNFFERDGKPVTLTVEQAYDMVFSLPVTYDAMQGTAKFAEIRSVVEEKPQQSVAALTEIASSTTPHGVRGKETSFSTKLETKAVGLQDMIRSQASRRVILHLTVSFTEEPKGSYHVYLKNGADAKAKGPQFIGQMTFFGAALHAGHAATDAANQHRFTKKFQFDVSDKIDLKAFNGDLSLLIKKDGDPKQKDELTVETQTLALH
jgi:hypothetical protein